MTELILAKNNLLDTILVIVSIVALPVVLYIYGNIGLFICVSVVSIVIFFVAIKLYVGNIRSYIKLDMESIEIQYDDLNRKYKWDSIYFQFEKSISGGCEPWNLTILNEFEGLEFVFLFDDFDMKREEFKALVSQYSRRSDIFKPDKIELMGIELKKKN